MRIDGREVRLGIALSHNTRHRAKEAYDAGITYVENSLFDSRASVEEAVHNGAEIYDACKSANLTPWSVHLPSGPIWSIDVLDEETRRGAVENLTPVMRMAAAWEAKVLVVHGCGFTSDKQEELEASVDACRRSLRELSLRAPGMRVAVENLPRTPLEHSAQVKRFSGDCAGLCFDVNHLLHQSHEEFLKDLERYVITTHLSDYDRGGQYGERHWLPGHAGGLVPWKYIFERMHDGGYRGPWMFEVDFKDETMRDLVDAFIRAIEG